MTKEETTKASLAQLNGLHDIVATALAKAVKEGDIRAMNAAIAFLKNNDITVDLVESKETNSLFKTVQDEISKAEDIDSLEDVLKVYS